MPKWIHDRARHIQAKNPEMPESQAFAIATQQAHAVGKSPKGYGTSEGRREAKSKYDSPSDDKKTADPGGVGADFVQSKEASPISITSPFEVALLGGFSDELQKIAGAGLVKTAQAPTGPSTVSQIKSLVPRPSMRANAPKYTKVNTDIPPSPVQSHQPLVNAPPVRG